VIVVVGSRHDPVVTELVERWPGAALCSAEDLTRPGWVWPSSATGGPPMWVVDGAPVADADVSGVFVRRATVYAEELTGTHAEDRTYLAAEIHAFLVYVLHRTGATVVNPVDDGGAFGEAALRPERWMAVAASLGVAVAPFRVRSARRPRPAEATELVEVVGGTALGPAPPELGAAAIAVCEGVGLQWAVLTFDRRGRLTAITTTARPSDEAVDHLGELLAGGQTA
jgi:hypothetical protein